MRSSGSALQGAWESFLDLYGAGAEPPSSPNAELMIAASLHQWMRVKEILQRLVDEKNGTHHCVRAGTPIPRNDTCHQACLDTPHHTMHVSPAVHAAGASTSHHAHSCDSDRADDTTPALKRRRDDNGSAVACAFAGDGCAVTSPRASGQEGGKERAGGGEAGHGKLGWLIAQLMGAREPGFVAVGQPCVMVRDRILTLLRPMMNFQVRFRTRRRVVLAVRSTRGSCVGQCARFRTVFGRCLCDGTAVTRECLLPGEGHVFQEEQDRMLDYELEHEMDYSADETLHIQVHRGQEILIDTVEQIRDVDNELLHRELTVEFLGEEGEDGGGLLREFCHVRSCYTSLLCGAACPARLSIGVQLFVVAWPCERPGEACACGCLRNACRSSGAGGAGACKCHTRPRLCALSASA